MTLSAPIPLDRASIIAKACSLIVDDSLAAASEYLHEEYAPIATSTSRKAWAAGRMIRVFMRDSFTDRYFGERLIFPGTMRALSILLSDAFPYHRNWKQSATHPAYYDLFPTIDHIVPLARGGKDTEENVVTTSMLRNSAKANWLIEELGWPAPQPATARNWDGLVGWFMTAWSEYEILRQDSALASWHRAARQAAS